ncbi:hypothetical protein LJK87_26135 [Paenibacillus sp. P25]|nr:hypothetical protein LJK87_26135 [Paenibacillus sp. P25]
MSKLNRRGAGKSRLNRPSRIGSHVNELSWLDERPEPDRVVKKREDGIIAQPPAASDDNVAETASILPEPPILKATGSGSVPQDRGA